MPRKKVAPDIIAYAKAHPNATYDEVAAAVGCGAALVRATFYRNDLVYMPTKAKRDQRSRVQRMRDAISDAMRHLKSNHPELALGALASVMEAQES